VLEYTSIANVEVVSKRKKQFTPAGLSLWHYVNLFFQPRNPMMYKIVKTRGNWDIPVQDFQELRKRNIMLTEED
jgi:hypothetical protein